PPTPTLLPDTPLFRPLKHSPNVTGTALSIEQFLLEAGLPAGVFRTLVISEPAVPVTVDHLIADDRIAAVTLTGSNRAGSSVVCEDRKSTRLNSSHVSI